LKFEKYVNINDKTAVSEWRFYCIKSGVNYDGAGKIDKHGKVVYRLYGEKEQ